MTDIGGGAYQIPDEFPLDDTDMLDLLLFNERETVAAIVQVGQIKPPRWEN